MRILLVCSAGMSTSMLVKKMRSAAADKGLDASIDATAEAGLSEELSSTDTDVILIGPQVRYLKDKITKTAESYGIKVDVIESIAYGMMDGKKVLDQAQNLLKK